VGATGIEPVTSAVSKLLGVFQRALAGGRFGENPPSQLRFRLSSSFTGLRRFSLSCGRGVDAATF
jgi:hypothetical protein